MTQKHLIHNLCKDGKHDLVAVFTSMQHWDYSEAVVRWCQNCGCVVVDTDLDGRVKPGDVASMRAPKLIQDIKNDYERTRKNNTDV